MKTLTTGNFTLGNISNIPTGAHKFITIIKMANEKREYSSKIQKL